MSQEFEIQKIRGEKDKMGMIRWIHFSDLHFNKTNINTRLLRDSIKIFLKENQIRCNYAFFSGDLRNAPDKYFQPGSVEYLQELCEAVEVPADHFFMVPGNHDVDRNIEQRDCAVKRILDNHGERKGYYNTNDGKIKESDLWDIKIGQKEYLKIIEKFYRDYPDRIEKYRECGHFLIETEDLNIVHLDSTITYTKGQEESLVIGTDLLYDLLEKVNPHKYTIILTHYPYDALKAEEKIKVCRVLEHFGVQIWMSGHLHNVLVQMHQKAFHELQCGNLLTDGGQPNILIGQLDTETGYGKVQAYQWQEDGGWTLNKFLDRMSETDKSVYSFYLRPTEVMKRSGKIYAKTEEDLKKDILIKNAIDQIERTYEDRYTIIRDYICGEVTYPVVVRSWTPGDMDAVYVIEETERNTYSIEKMERWLAKLAVYWENYVRILNRDTVGELRLVCVETCGKEEKERYKKDFQDIYERKYKKKIFQLVICEQNSSEEQEKKVFISSASTLPIEKEMIYAMDIGMVAKVKALKPVLLEKYDTIQEINQKIDEYYHSVWDEWRQSVEENKTDSLMMERIAKQEEKNTISDGTLTDCLEYKITHNNDGLCSILFERYFYRGGAHATPLRKSMVVDLNTGVEISLHEVLPMSFAELMRIVKERLFIKYRQEDEEILETCYENIRELYHRVDDFKFYIQYSSLYIYFDVYEISSYSMGYMDLYIMDVHERLKERGEIGEREIIRKKEMFLMRD